MSKQVKSEASRERILAAAIELFRESGFDATTMRDIASAAGVALGGAYYYFDSKEALAMAFYEKAHIEMTPLLETALTSSKDLGKRLRAAIRVKLDYFARDRALLGALSSHIDPKDPLSPFSDATASIRNEDIAVFGRALSGGKIPADLAPHMPRLLWLYQMGIILFWVYDSSPSQERTSKLLDHSLRIVVNLIRFSSLPFMRPVRRQAVDLLRIVHGSLAADTSLTPANETD